MITPEIIHEIFYKIISNFNETEVVFGGSISDYFLYRKYSIKPNFNIRDVDIIIFDESIVEKIENIFNSKANYKGLFKTNIFLDYNQYHIYYNGSLIDIFLFERNSTNIEIATYCGYKLSHYNIYDRVDILNKAIQYEYLFMQLNNVRQFKHIKKLMVYNEILNG